MPSYRTHVSVNLAFGLPLSLAALKYTVQSTPTDTLAFSAAFIYGTLFLHPDLDLARHIRLFSLKGLLLLCFCLGYGFHWHQPCLWFAIGGLAIADLFHVLLDPLK